MPINVVCGGCGKQYRVSEQAAGKRLRCRECGREMLVPAPATAEVDPFEELAAMERNAAPAPPPLKRGPLITQRPVDTIDVKADAPSERFREPPRFGRSKAAAVGTDNLSPWAVIAFVVLQIVLAIIATVHARQSPQASHGNQIAMIWTSAIVSIGLLFLVLGPAVFLGVFITSKIFRFQVVDLGWLRGCGIAAIPSLLVMGAAFLPDDVISSIGTGFPLLIGVVAIVLCFLALKYVFDLDWVGGLVAYAFSGPLYAAGVFLAAGVVGVMLAQIFRDASPPSRNFFDDRQYVHARPQPAPSQPPPPPQARPAPPVADTDVQEKTAKTDENLRQIGQAAQKFAAATDKNLFPPNLETLVSAGDVAPHCLNSPFNSGPGGYTYWPDRSPAMPADVGIAYDSAELASRGQTHVLFANGNVETRTSAQFASLVSHSKQAALDWTTDQQFKEKQRQEAMAKEKAAPPPHPTEPPVPKPQDFVSIFTAQKSPFVASVSPVFALPQVRSIISPIPPSPYALVVRDAGNLDTVDLWDLSAVQNKGEASFPREGGDSSYVLSPDGAWIARLVHFPKLGVRIWSTRESRDTRTLLLNEMLGTPTLYGFLSPDKLGVIWSKSLEGMEIWDVTTGRVAHQTPFQPYQRSVNNGVTSPDGREFAFTSARIPRGSPQVALFNLYATLNSKWKFHEILDVDAADVNSPAGLAFSPDGKKLAALFARQGAGFVICWRTADIKLAGEYEVAVPAAGGVQERGLEWVHNGATWLLMGNTLVDAADGKTLGQLNSPPTLRQWSIAPDTLALMYTEDGKTGLALAKLDPSKFPQPGPATKTAEERKH